jgi:putative toxin-antitoxin system antitoxin component (TIGR02293 family)
MSTLSAIQTAQTVLGIGKRWTSPVQLIDAIKEGFPLKAFERICEAIAPDNAAFKYLLVPKTSLHRLYEKEHALLSRQQSEQIARLARVWARSLDVWGNAADARRFLNEPHALLDGRSPIAVTLDADIGVTMVEDILGRLQYGSAA